jgi:hypothetical protein
MKHGGTGGWPSSRGGLRHGSGVGASSRTGSTHANEACRVARRTEQSALVASASPLLMPVGQSAGMTHHVQGVGATLGRVDQHVNRNSARHASREKQEHSLADVGPYRRAVEAIGIASVRGRSQVPVANAAPRSHGVGSERHDAGAHRCTVSPASWGRGKSPQAPLRPSRISD